MDFDQLESDITAIELSKRSIVLHGPFVDYSTFEDYIERYDIPVFQSVALEFGQRLGRGAIWTVFQGTITTAEAKLDVAIKRLNLAIPQTYSDVDPYTLDLREQLAIASLEIRALTTPALKGHGNIARLLGVSWEDVGPGNDLKLASRRPLIIMELAELAHPTLDTLLEGQDTTAGLGLDSKCSIIAGVAEALSTIHECGIIHGDLKPGNILMFREKGASSYVAKISDFGGCQPSAAGEYDSSKVTADLEVFPLAGTRLWNAPEVSLVTHPHFRSKFRDYYSMGLVIYFALFGTLPYEQSDDSADSLRFEANGTERRIIPVVTQSLSHLLERYADVRLFTLALAIVVLLRHDPEKRAKDRFVKDCRAFLKDKELGHYLQTVYRSGIWEEFLHEYLQDRRDLWEMRFAIICTSSRATLLTSSSSTISAGRGFFATRPEYLQHSLNSVALGDLEAHKYEPECVQQSELTSHFDADEAECMLLKLLKHLPDQVRFVQSLRQRDADQQFVSIALSASLCEVFRVSVVDTEHPIDNTSGDWVELISAVFQGQDGAVKQCLMSEKRQLADCTIGGMNMLQLAAHRGFAEVVETLLDDGRIDMNACTCDGLDPLTLAINALHCDVARSLYDRGASVDAVLNLGTLRFMANYGDFPCLSLLDEMLHARWGSQDSPQAMETSFWNGEGDKWPTLAPPEEPKFHPVIAAILGGNSTALWFLLERGVARDQEFSFNVAGRQAWLKPIHLAALLRPLHIALLVHYGADADARTRPTKEDEPFGKFTALHLACTAPRPAAYMFPWARKHQIADDVDPEAYMGDGVERNMSRLACLKLLVQACPSTLNAKDKPGLTALSHCMTSHKDVHTNNLAMATMLVGLGADVHTADAQGLTCLHRAIIFNRDDRDIGLVKFLLHQAVDLERRDINGYTPLMVAAEHGRVSVARFLLDRGANICARSRLNYDVLSLTLGARQFETFELLFNTAEKLGLLEDIMLQRDFDIEQGLLTRICRQPNLHPLLHRLPRHSVRQHIDDTDVTGFTALHIAVSARNPEAVKVLLGLGADANVQGCNNLTAAHFAFGMGQEDIIEILRKRDPDLTLRDDRGWVPEDYGAQRRLNLSFWDDTITDILAKSHTLSRENYDKKYAHITEQPQ
ncbi:hypothetical protein LTR17_016120 [Elasticomyces elasticus]|nr:hypothetical protein LTR17_016120 [Elasticomyces elasticus]